MKRALIIAGVLAGGLTLTGCDAADGSYVCKDNRTGERVASSFCEIDDAQFDPRHHSAWFLPTGHGIEEGEKVVGGSKYAPEGATLQIEDDDDHETKTKTSKKKVL